MRNTTLSNLLAAACLVQIGRALETEAPGIDNARRDEEWTVTPTIIKSSIDAMNTAWSVSLDIPLPHPSNGISSLVHFHEQSHRANNAGRPGHSNYTAISY